MRREVAESIIKGWHDNEGIVECVKRGIFMAGDIPTQELILLETPNVFNTKGKNRTVRKWLGCGCTMVADVLWDGKPDAVAVELLLRTLPDKRVRPIFGERGKGVERTKAHSVRVIHARALKNRDWDNVK